MDFITCWASLGLWCVLYYLLSSGFTICIYNWWWCMLWPLAVTKQWPVGSLSPVAGPLVTLVTLVPPRDTWHVTPHRTGSGNTFVNLVNRIVWVVGYLAGSRWQWYVLWAVTSLGWGAFQLRVSGVPPESWPRLAPPGPALHKKVGVGGWWVVGGHWSAECLTLLHPLSPPSPLPPPSPATR